jgi:hypothetical protein
MAAPMEPRRVRPLSIGAFIAGFVVALVVNFGIALNGFSFSGTTSRQIQDVLLAWVITIVVFAVLYRMHPWAAYGALGAYVALFALLSLTAGLAGPYTCFGAYGYPNPYR